MKTKNILLALSITTSIILFSGCSHYLRIGEVTVISTRNYDSNADYELKKKYIEAKASKKQAQFQNTDMLTLAIEKAVKEDPKGEFLKNAKIYISARGDKMKIEADVWGNK